MTFEQLECFIYAVQENTFFDAAEALHITQSSLSKQIKKMEQELGIQLFDRSKRSAVLTQAGEFFYPEAQKLSLQYQKTIAKMKEFNTRFSSSLCVGTLPVLSQYGLTHFFHQFATLHPEISLSLFEVEEPELMAGFEKGRFDCIIARESMITDPDCIFIPMASDTLSVILPLSHPLAHRDEILFMRFPGKALFSCIPTLPFINCVSGFLTKQIYAHTFFAQYAWSLLSAPLRLEKASAFLRKKILTCFNTPVLFLFR